MSESKEREKAAAPRSAIARASKTRSRAASSWR